MLYFYFIVHLKLTRMSFDIGVPRIRLHDIGIETAGRLTRRTETMTNIARLVRDESGATAIEYGLIASLIAVGIISAASALGSNLSNTFMNITSQLK